MYEQCVQNAHHINNGVVDVCSERASAAAKTEMNELYETLYEQLMSVSPDEAAQLERAQKSWIVYRNLHCDLAGAHVGSPMYSFCPMTLNIARVKELRELSGQ